MRVLAVCLLLTLTACERKEAEVKRLQDQYNAEYPPYAKECLEEDNSGATRLLTGQTLTKEQMADLEAKKNDREVRCKSKADHLAQIQREIVAAQQ